MGLSGKPWVIGTASGVFIFIGGAGIAWMEMPDTWKEPQGALLTMWVFLPVLAVIGLKAGQVVMDLARYRQSAAGVAPTSGAPAATTLFGKALRTSSWGFLILAAGVWIGGPALYPYWQQYQAREWNAVPAEVISSSVQNSTSTRGMISYTSNVRYRYQVGGATHIGDTVRFGSYRGLRDEAEQTVRRFPLGASVAAYVNPENAEQSVLDREAVSGAAQTNLNIVMGVLALGVIVVAGCVAVVVMRERSE
jgi:hypothetical protein